MPCDSDKALDQVDNLLVRYGLCCSIILTLSSIGVLYSIYLYSDTRGQSATPSQRHSPLSRSHSLSTQIYNAEIYTVCKYTRECRLFPRPLSAGEARDDDRSDAGAVQLRVRGRGELDDKAMVGPARTRRRNGARIRPRAPRRRWVHLGWLRPA